MNKAKKYLKLFTTCFYISAFTFGGGFVIIPLMRRKFVEDLKWLEENEMMDLTAIAQSSPGAIAVNAAILTGYKIGSVAGAMIAMLATVLPPVIIITVISFFYNAFRQNAVVGAVMKGMQAGVAAVICDVVIRMGSGVFKQKNALFIVVMAAAFVLTFFLDVNVIFIILGCILLSVCIFLFKAAVKRKKRRKNLSESGNQTSLIPSDGQEDAAQEEASKTCLSEADSAQAKQTSEEEQTSVTVQLETPENNATEQDGIDKQCESIEQRADNKQRLNAEQTSVTAQLEKSENNATEQDESDYPKEKAAPKTNIGKGDKAVLPSEREKEREK